MAKRGFTLIELLVVLAALAVLLTMATPRYLQHVDRSREVVLRHNLAAMREAIDKFRGDRARWPRDLPELVREGYLREVPIDPIIERADAWVPLGPGSQAGSAGELADVRSGARGQGSDGTSYAKW